MELAKAIHRDDGKGKREKKERCPRLCGQMTGPSSTTRLGCGRFSRLNGVDAEEDRGSDGNNGTPDDRGS